MLRWLILLVMAGCTQVVADEVGLVVNDHVLTRDELQQEISMFARFAGLPEDSSDDKMLAQSVVNMLTQRLLVEDFAQYNQLALTTEEQEEAIDHYVSMVGVEKEGLDLHADELGVPPKWIRDFLITQALVNKVGVMVLGAKIQVSPEDVSEVKQTLYEGESEYLLRSWILPHDHESASIEHVKAIKYDWAQSGDDPKVGEVLELGWKKRADLPNIFVSAIEGIEAGNIVGPLVSEHGYHLVWYEQVKEPVLPSDEYLSKVLFQKKFQESYSEWLTDLKEKSAVIQKF